MDQLATRPGPRYEALLQLLRTAEALWESSRVFFGRWNLSPSQFNILNLLLAPSEGLSQIELSRALIMHRSNVTGLVDRLEKRGLVVRRTSETDRRVYRVGLTAAGQQLLEQILPHYYTTAEQVWGGLPVERAKQLAAELGQVSTRASQLAGTPAGVVPVTKPMRKQPRRRRAVRKVQVGGGKKSTPASISAPVEDATSTPKPP